jgi:PIN domain nuclease of toxin-antitoxin system
VDPGNRIWISPASYWEIAIKISRGKFSVLGPYDAFWQDTIDRNRFEILPFEIRHAARLIGLPFHHRDPFDRLLAAQALAEDVSLVSSDAVFDRYGLRRVW